MKKTFLALAASTFITGAIMTSCSSSAEKVEIAQKNVIDANKELENASKAYLVDIENYRKETESRISVYDQIIVDAKAKMENEKNAAKDEYKIIIADLEQKNNDMKRKMSDYKADGKEKWESFKAEFSHDMDELGQAFKDLTVKNVK